METSIGLILRKKFLGAAMNINYYKGHFYYVTWGGKFWSFEVAGPSTPKPVVEPRLLYRSDDDIFGQCSVQFYLVELSNALLFVTRFAHDIDCGHKTFKF